MEIKNEVLEVEEVSEIVETKDDEGNDLTDWKAEALKNQGIAKRFKTKFEKAKDLIKTNAEKKPEPPIKEDKKGFDYAEKAFLKANNINSDEYDFVDEVMKSTGKSLDEILEAKYFQSELKERRELKASKDAIPEGNRRSAPSANTDVDYWLAKDELPKNNPELARKVVNARIKTEENKSKFSDTPVIG